MSVAGPTTSQSTLPDRGEVTVTACGRVSIVTPAYNEAASLPLLYERLREVVTAAGLEWEWIVVDDHSSDATFAVVSEIMRRDPHVRGFRFSRNWGSHTAIACGMHYATGDGLVVIAADLQDPPDVIPDLVARWRDGAQVVWAVRSGREGERVSTIGFSRLYYLLMRTVVGVRDMPSTGADFLLIDRRVVNALLEFSEQNVSLFALISWMGFRQATVSYNKQARLHGRSGWTVKKKLKLLVDSVTAFTYLPIRLMSYAGIATALAGFGYAAVVFVRALGGNPVQGWASLMIAVLVFSGLQMIMMGVLGEYLWRALDESRRRPRYLVEAGLDSDHARSPERSRGSTVVTTNPSLPAKDAEP